MEQQTISESSQARLPAQSEPGGGHCLGCQIWKPFSEFYWHTQSAAPRSRCKECLDAANRRWAANNPDAARKISRRSNYTGDLRRYGITPQQFDWLHANSDGRCQICRQLDNRRRRLSIDHDHLTREIRGLLCSRCNLMLGHVEDNVELLRSAIAYLEGQRPRIDRDAMPSPETTGHRSDGKRNWPGPVRDAVIATLNATGMTARAIAETVGAKRPSVQAALARLAIAGKAQKCGWGLWRAATPHLEKKEQ